MDRGIKEADVYQLYINRISNVYQMYIEYISNERQKQLITKVIL